MCNALRNVRRWIGSNFMVSVNDYHDAYMRWAKTEYKNDWQYHYNRLMDEAKQRRQNSQAK